MEGPTGKPAHEAQLINAPVVHGYRMTVLSPVTAMLLRTSELGRFDAKRQIDVVRRIAPHRTGSPQTAQVQRRLALAAASLRQVRRARIAADLILRHTVPEQLGSVTHDLTDMVGYLLQKARADEIASARAQHARARHLCVGWRARASRIEPLLGAARQRGATTRRAARNPSAGGLCRRALVAPLGGSWLTAPRRAGRLVCRARPGRTIRPFGATAYVSRGHIGCAALHPLTPQRSDQPTPSSVGLRLAEIPGPGRCALAGRAARSLALIGLAASGREPVVRISSGELGAARAALAAAWQRRLPYHVI